LCAIYGQLVAKLNGMDCDVSVDVSTEIVSTAIHTSIMRYTANFFQVHSEMLDILYLPVD
jgi:hypothetical protein